MTKTTYKINYLERFPFKGGSYESGRDTDEIDAEIKKTLRQSADASSAFNFKREFSIPDTLRVKIINDYKKILRPYFDFSTLNSLSSIVSQTNKLYTDRRPDHGIYYADDYTKLKGSSDLWTSITGVSNSNYFDLATHDSFFKIKDGILPSDGIKAFFAGPTFADCANVIQASIYQYIMNKIGIDKFNLIFGRSITQLVITKWLYTPFESKSKSDNPHGNPLYSLFDPIPDININLLEDGDIVYIEGVGEYTSKHLCGFAPGWNLVVVKNEGQPVKFIGFGPGTFGKGPLTYDELRLILIKYYNQDHSRETLDRIKKFSSKLQIGSSSVGLSDVESLNKIRIDLASMLKNDKKPDDFKINGLKIGIRLNQQKLNDFIENLLREDGWYDLDVEYYLPMIRDIPTDILPNKKLLASISSENKDSSFENYIHDTTERLYMLNIMKKFAYTVDLQKPEIGPIGIIISGKPGIGKTHLSIAVMKNVHKNVLYLDEKYISELFQESGSYGNYESWISGADLIIIDDLNTKYGIGATFFKKAIDYVIKNNKAILVSSNTHLDMMYESLPFYVGFDSKINKNFLIINDIIAVSYRKPWISSFSGLTNRNKLITLSQYQKGAAAVVIHSDDNSYENAERIMEEYSGLLATKPVVRIAKEPMRNHRVYDLYMHHIDRFNTFIINVFDYEEEGNQLIHLVEKVHDKGAKIIVISKNDKTFVDNVKKTLDSFLKKEYRERRYDRLRILFPNMFD